MRRSNVARADWEIRGNSVIFGPRVGVGNFAEVFKATLGERSVAVKRFLAQEKWQAKDFEAFCTEAAFLLSLKHPCVCEMIGQA